MGGAEVHHATIDPRIFATPSNLPKTESHFLRMLAEYPEMTVEIMRVLAERLSHTTAELTEERSKRRATQ
jgi:CRP-like cAMP-binding protein